MDHTRSSSTLTSDVSASATSVSKNVTDVSGAVTTCSTSRVADEKGRATKLHYTTALWLSCCGEETRFPWLTLPSTIQSPFRCFHGRSRHQNM